MKNNLNNLKILTFLLLFLCNSIFAQKGPKKLILGAGAGTEPLTISEDINTQGEATLNFDFTLNASGQNYTITDIVINQETGNEIADWTTVIQGAIITDGTNDYTTTIGTTSITSQTFSNLITDGDTKTFTLKIWLVNSVPPTAIDKYLVFQVDDADITPSASTGGPISSGTTNNKIIASTGPTTEIIIGTGTGTEYTVTPYRGYYSDVRYQFIITAAELTGAGLNSGDELSSIFFNVANHGSSVSFPNFNINIGHTSTSSFASASWLTPTFTNVFSGSYTYSGTGWHEHPFSTNFTWNGTDNIVVQTCFDLASSDGTDGVKYTTTSGNTVCYAETDGDHGCSLSAEHTSNHRPNMKFTVVVPNVGANTITAGDNNETATIPSLTDTQGEALINFDFTITDDGETPSTDGDNTLISSVTITQGTGNDITDWTEAIAGALLTDGSNTQTADITINAGTIIISNISNGNGDLGYIADNGNKKYTLKIWLKSTMGGTLAQTIDHENFVFKVEETGITTASGSSDFAENQSTNSGAANNEVVVNVSQISFTTQPSPWADLNTNLVQAPAVSGTDANGNVDEDYSSTITISNSGSFGMINNSVASSNGISTFTNLQFTSGAGTITLTASDGTYTTAVPSTVITICGAYSIPFSENFDEISPALPDMSYCWTVDNANNDAEEWTRQTENPNSSPNCMRIKYTSSVMDDWFFTPGLALSNGVTYKVKFYYRALSNDVKEYLEIQWGSSPTVGGMSEGVIYTNENLVGMSYQEATAEFTPSSSGTYYLGWHGYSPANQWYIYIDDIEITQTAVVSGQWTGNISTDWNTTGNWSDGIIPAGGCSGAGSDATIPDVSAASGNFPIISGSAECDNLTIDIGANLQISPTGSLTVCADITNNAGNSGLVLKSDATGTGSLICSTVDVPATIERFLAGTQYHYISSPITSATTAGIGIQGGINGVQFYQWDANATWLGLGATPPATIDYLPWGTAYSGTLSVGKGYAYYYYESTLNFAGNINVGDYSLTLYKSSSGVDADQGWNLIGNPYSSAIDWDLTAAGLPNTGQNKVEGAVYLFDGDGTGANTNYRYYVPADPGTGGTYGVGSSDATRYIPVGQGFFIRTRKDGLTADINVSQRVHNTQSFYKKNNEIHPDLLRITAEGNGKSDEMTIRFIKNATDSIDAKYDARKLIPANQNIPQIYSITADNIKSAINSMPELVKNYDVSLGFICVAGTYTFNVKELNFDNTKIYLEDLETKTIILLSNETVYKFYHNGGVNENRFILHFVVNTAVNIYDIYNNVKIYPNPNTGHFNIYTSKQNIIQKIEIYDVFGKIIWQNINIKSHLKEIDLSEQTKGLYFVKIFNKNNTYTCYKVMVN